MKTKGAAIALGLLLLVPSGMAWTQLAGDAGRTGVAPLPDGPLDVTAVIDLEAEGLSMDVNVAPVAVTTPQGLLVFAQNASDNDCYLVAIDPTGALSRTEVPACSGNGQGGALIGYDEVRDLAFLCLDVYSPGEEFLHAVDPETGEAAWSITPSQLLAAAPSSSQGPTTDASGNAWECRAGAVDDELGTLYLPAVAYGGADGDANRGTDHRIAAILTDEGELDWVTYLDASVIAEQESDQDIPDLSGVLNDDSIDPSAPFQRTEVDAVTRTATGLVVVGEINDGGMAVTMGLDGNITAVHQAAPSGGLTSELLEQEAGSTSGNAWAVATGPLAVLGLGNDLLLIDPLTEEPQFRTSPQTTQTFDANDHIGPALLQDVALVPSSNALIAVDAGTFQVQWQHLAAPDAQTTSLLGALTSADGRIYTMEDHPNHGVRVSLLDPTNGRSLAAWPLPINVTSFPDISRTRLTAAPGLGLVVLQEAGGGTTPGATQSAQGRILLMGKTEGAPALDLTPSTDAPPSGEPLTLTVDEAALTDAVGLTVYWGDGTYDRYDPRKALDHIYFGSGMTTITAVAERADGTTYSESKQVDVDGLQLSWIQEQFQPGNLDMTWGVIGIALGLLGGLTTYIVTTLKRRRMKREMDRLDAIQDLAIAEPVLAMRRLREYRADLRGRAKSGKLDDPPLASLLQEVTKLFHTIEQRMLSVFGPRMTAGMRRAMDAAFADGVLSTSELKDLQGRLKKETRLSKSERDELGDLLANWV